MPSKRARFRVIIVAIAAATGLLSWGFAQVSAQTINSSSIQSVLQSLGTGGSATSQPGVPPPASPVQVTPSVSPSSQSLSPATPPTSAMLPTSTLELLFSQRAGQPLQQFGYDIFGMGTSVNVAQIGNVQDSYVLGTGDVLSVVCRGHDNNSYVVPVDRDGRLIIPNYEPVQAAGRTFGQVRHDLQAVISKDALSTQAYISLAQTRQISVLVTGEVNAPGARAVSGLNTPIDALLLSGGVRKTGSLRNIILLRAGRRIRIDLYGVLARGSVKDVGNLVDGDQIIVPPIGSTVAAIGLVNRPGIYELPSGSSGIDGSALVRLAGGKMAGANHLSKIILQPTGRMELEALGAGGFVRNGELLSVDQEASGMTGKVVLAGAVQLPGTRSLARAPTLSRLLRQSSDLMPNAYTPLGIVIHLQRGTNYRHPVAFSLQRVFLGQEDVTLGDGDVVFILGTDQARALANAAAAQVVSAAQAESSPPSEVTLALSASNAQTTASSVQAAQTPAPAGTSTAPVASPTSTASTPTNTAAAIYAGANGGAPSPSTSSPAGGPAGVAQAVTTGVGQAVTGVMNGSMPIGTTAPPPSSQSVPQTALMTSLPLPPIAPYQANVAAAASMQPPASIALLQSQSAQSAAAGITFQGGGLTTPMALGVTADDVNPVDIAAELGLTPTALVNFAGDYLVWIVGEVHDPGNYLAEAGTSLASMLTAAGGLQVQADLSSVNVTTTEIDPLTGTSHTLRNAYQGRGDADFEKVALRPLDTVIVRQVFSDRDAGTVTVVGQVRYPGSFDILRSERLSSLLARAGGLTDEAYPYGAVFTRISAQQSEAAGNYREAVELQTGALVAATTPNVNPSLLTYLQTLQQQLLHQPALGRISVTADPTVLAVKPELDTLLQPGDFIYVPKRPSTVSVSGEVLNPGSFQYRPDLGINDYLDLAGGMTNTAEDDEMFVILPDGSARTGSSSILHFFGSDPIPPGSTIVIPPNPAPFNTMVFLTSLSQIFGQLAIAGASLAAISHTNS